MDNINTSNITDLTAIMRILGNLYYRHPTSPELASLYNLIFRGKLYESWPINQEELFKRLANHDLVDIANAYDRLFDEKNAKVSLLLTDEIAKTQDMLSVSDIKAYAAQVGMPTHAETNYAHYGFHWLLLAWIEAGAYDVQCKIENQTEGNSIDLDGLHSENELLQNLYQSLFNELIQPFSAYLLGKIEANAEHDFYKVLAMMTREVIFEISILMHEMMDEDNLVN